MKQPHFASVVIALAAVTALIALSGCDIAQPFEGPGYVLGEGPTTEAEGPFIASTTLLIVGDDDGDRAAFDEHMAALGEALPAQPGLIGKSLSFGVGTVGYRTLSVWESEEAVLGWVTSDVHSAAMSDMAERVKEGSVTSWSMTRAELEEGPPSWDDAKARLDAEGRQVY